MLAVLFIYKIHWRGRKRELNYNLHKDWLPRFLGSDTEKAVTPRHPLIKFKSDQCLQIPTMCHLVLTGSREFVMQGLSFKKLTIQWSLHYIHKPFNICYRTSVLRMNKWEFPVEGLTQSKFNILLQYILPFVALYLLFLIYFRWRYIHLLIIV